MVEAIGDPLRSRSIELGGVVPVRPWPSSGALGPSHCLRGHDLQRAGVAVGFNSLYDLPSRRCELCIEQRDERATWCLADPANVIDQPDGATGLRLIQSPPAVRGGTGTIAVVVHHHIIGDVDVAVCGPCGRACLEQVRVDERYRRMGFGRLLLTAVLTRMPAERYNWSTTAIAADLPARAFWATVNFPGVLGQPDYCRDQRAAAGEYVEW